MWKAAARTVSNLAQPLVWLLRCAAILPIVVYEILTDRLPQNDDALVADEHWSLPPETPAAPTATHRPAPTRTAPLPHAAAPHK